MMMRILLVVGILFAWALLTHPDPDSPSRNRRFSAVPTHPQEVASSPNLPIAEAHVAARPMPQAVVSPSGDSFRIDWPGSVEWSPRAMEVRSGGTHSAPRLESISREPGVVTLNYAGIEEQYLFMIDGRVEQIFVVHEKPASGALSVSTSIETSLTGPVVRIRRSEPGWNNIEMMKGGLWFTDAAGRPVLAYYGAVAIDADGRRLEFEPEWQDGRIVLSVPEPFVAEASFPLTIDPFIELGGSGTGGGISNNAGASLFPSMRLDSSDFPVVAWQDDTADPFGEIYLKRWNGSAWIELAGSATGGGISSTAGTSLYPSLVLDSSGQPFVAWEDDTSGDIEIYLKYWDGDSWEELAGSATGGGVSAAAGGSYSPSLAVNASGHPVVAWAQDVAGNFEIYVKYWDGDSWEEWGGSATGGGVSANAGFSQNPSLALDASGNPVVAWEDTTGGNSEIYLRRWNGASWEELAGSGTGGGISATAGASGQVSLALNSSGHPAVAWEDDTDGDLEIYYKQWNGVSWSEVNGSATGGGISNDSTDSNAASLAISGLRIVVAWSQIVSGISDIYLKLLSGGVWIELENSATATGISSTGGNSSNPSLALATSTDPVVAWDENVNSNTEIYVRKFTRPKESALSSRTLQIAPGQPTCGLTGMEPILVLMILGILGRRKRRPVPEGR